MLIPLLLGLIIGSFLNVVLFRFGKDETMVWGRSVCRSCERALGPRELIPVLSYVVQRGRCRWCSVDLSLQYPAVELATALSFALVAWWLAPALSLLSLLELALWLAATALLILIFVHDLRTTYIPNAFVYPLIALSGALLFIEGGALTLPTLAHVATGPLLLMPFFVLWDLSGGHLIGLGDGKLAWVLGWLLGPMGGASAVVFGFWIGAVVVLLRMFFERLRRHAPEARLRGGSEVAFGPFLIVGGALVLFTGLSFLTPVDALTALIVWPFTL